MQWATVLGAAKRSGVKISKDGVTTNTVYFIK